MMLMSKIIYPSQSWSQRWESIIKHNVAPAVKNYDILGERNSLGAIPDEEQGEVGEVLAGNRKQLRTLFRHYAAGDENDKSGDQEAGSIDTSEFLLLAKQCKFPQCGISFSQSLQVFIQCNQEEMGAYLGGSADGDLFNYLQMEFGEFMEAMLKFTSLVAAAYAGVKKKTFGTHLQDFCEKVFREAPAKLRLG